MPNILVTICARGGTKGILGKNIKPVGGKPLIAYTIATSRKFTKRVGPYFVHLAFLVGTKRVKI